MSRIGKLPIEIPTGVKVAISGLNVSVEGPKGKLSRTIMDGVTINVEEKQISVVRNDDSIGARSAHGLVRTLINNMVVGVTKGFEKALEINGVGYRAAIQGNVLNLQLGFSHDINYDIPAGMTIAVDKNVISIKGVDKQQVGQVAAEIRSFRPPEPYKGKGIRYANETILRKAGKTGKK